jgi:hypothetical protein
MHGTNYAVICACTEPDLPELLIGKLQRHVRI